MQGVYNDRIDRWSGGSRWEKEEMNEDPMARYVHLLLKRARAREQAIGRKNIYIDDDGDDNY